MPKNVFRRTAVRMSPRFYWRARYLRRGLEEAELVLLPRLCRPGTTVLDIGANLGMYSYWLDKLDVDLIAFEPIPRLAQGLVKGFGGSMTVHNLALSDHEGEATLHQTASSPGLSTIDVANPLSQREVSDRPSLVVPTRELDSFQIENVSFVKLDVEGHEESVLRGASSVLSQQPSLLVELEERHNAGCIQRVIDLLGSYGLVGAGLFDGQLKRLSEIDVIAHQRDTHVELYVRNFIFGTEDVLKGLEAELPTKQDLLTRKGHTGRDTVNGAASGAA